MNEQHDNANIHLDTQSSSNAESVSSALAKLSDAETPGYQAEFDPPEAETAGAFREDALSEADALGSTHEVPEATADAVSQKS